MIAPPQGGRDEVTSALDHALRQAIEPDVEITSPAGEPLPDVRYVHRRAGSRHVFFLANTSDCGAQAVISLETTGAVEEWNPETGERAPAEGVEPADGRLRISRDFAPYGSTIYVVDTGRSAQVTPRRRVTRKELIVLPDEWSFRTEEPNAVVLDEWVFHPKTHSAGTDYTYAASFDCDFVPDSLFLMLDDVEYRSSLMGGMDLTVQVNGQVWHKPEFGCYLDRGFKTLDIAGAVGPGRNRIEIVIKHSAWSGQPHALNAPPALLGDFACDVGSRRLSEPAASVPSGSWTEFGYPFFSGTGVYTQSFDLPERAGAGRLIVSVDSPSDSAEIIVNGASAGVRVWPPWEADVTDLLETGSNELAIKVTNSMQNFLEATPRPSGLMGRVRLLVED